MRHPREPLNFYTHAIPALIAIPAAAILFLRSSTHIQFSAAVMYGICTVVLFSISAVYHGYPKTPKEIRFWQKMDHCCIYLMIAGSYTPTTLLVFDGGIRWALFGTIWNVVEGLVSLFTILILKFITKNTDSLIFIGLTLNVIGTILQFSLPESPKWLYSKK